MSIIIKGMEMPKNCDECFFVGRGFPDWCSLPQIQKDEDEIEDTNNKPDWCPLEEVPDSKEQENDKTLLKSEHDDVSKGDFISRQAAIDDFTKWKYQLADCFGEDYSGVSIVESAIKSLEGYPSAQPEPQWNNHTVACLLADLYGDPCACNYNNISEWLPEKCEVIDACPNPVGVACWEQFLKHRAERRTDE